MLIKLLTATIMGLAGSSAAHADWLTSAEDDLFSNGQIGTMAGTDINIAWSVYMVCTPGQPLEFKFLQEDTSSPDNGDFIPVQMVLTTDRGFRWEADGEMSRHNDTFVGVELLEATGLKGVVEAIRDAQREVTVGVNIPAANYRAQSVISARGSTRAASQMLEICDFDASSGGAQQTVSEGPPPEQTEVQRTAPVPMKSK